jgi:hypothetical protein
MGVTVNHWLVEFDSLMRSQIWVVSLVGKTLALHAGVGSSNLPRSTNFSIALLVKWYNS